MSSEEKFGQHLKRKLMTHARKGGNLAAHLYLIGSLQGERIGIKMMMYIF